MSGWNAKYKNDFGEYEITFYSKDYEKTKAVEKVCCAIMDGKVKEAADVAPVRHGRWTTTETILGRCCVCSACGSCPTLEYRFCPYCGARMDLEVSE